MDAETGLCLCCLHAIKSFPRDKAHIVLTVSMLRNFIWQNIKKKIDIKTKYAPQPVHVHNEMFPSITVFHTFPIFKKWTCPKF